MDSAVLALDIGATNTRLSVQAIDTGDELCREVLPTQGESFSSSLVNMTEVVKQFGRSYALRAVGAGVAGVVKDGIITGSGNLPDWVNRNLQTSFKTAFGIPAIVGNDCRMAAIGEYTTLRCPLFYVIWGSGVGGTMVADDGTAQDTEFGHITIDRESHLCCGCGGYGHLEAHVGGKGIVKRYGCEAEKLHSGQWGVVIKDMAIGLRSLSALQMNVPVVLGGGIATKQIGRLPQLQTIVNALPSTCPPPKLLAATCGEDGGLIGAGYAARQLAAA